MTRWLFAASLLLAVSHAAFGQTPKVTSSAYNPAVSLILMGRYADFAQHPAHYALPGFALAEETGPGAQGLSLSESELVLSANADPLFYGELNAALTAEDRLEIEEAFFETLAVGGGFIAKGGRYLSHIGYLNRLHPHAWDFVDMPLAYRALLGEQFGDDGLQLRWVAPTDLFLELGAELFRGESFPAGGAADDGKGARAAFLHLGGDVGASHSWRAGLWRLRAKAWERATGDPMTPDRFSGDSEVSGVDFVWKWAPGGNPKERNFKVQMEYFQRDENGTFDPASSGTPLDYQGRQRGWYAQAVYQFMPRWRIGVRYDRLEADPVGAALAGTVLDSQGHEPERAAAMVDFSPSEFSRLRVQVNRDESRANKKDTQWYLQYIISLGAHGAHAF